MAYQDPINIPSPSGLRRVSTKVAVYGVSGIIRKMQTVMGETEQGMARGLLKAGIFLKEKSQEVVPVDTGALRASAFVKKEGYGFKTNVKVGYGGSSAEVTTLMAPKAAHPEKYAIYVHEDLEAGHSGGRTAKYLERPARLHRAEMIRIIREEAQK